MCDGCEAKPDDLLIPQLAHGGVLKMPDPMPLIGEMPSEQTLPRGLLFWNESRRQDALENVK